MGKLSLFILTIILPLSVFGKVVAFKNTSVKDSVPKQKTYSLQKYYFSINIGGQYCYRNINSDQSDFYAYDILYYPIHFYYSKNNDKPGAGYNLFLQNNFRIKGNLRLNIGLGLDVLKYQTKHIDTLYVHITNTGSSYNYAPGKYVQNSTIHFKYAYLSLPVSFNYYFRTSHKTFFNFGLGCFLSYVISQDADINYPPNSPMEVSLKHSLLYTSPKQNSFLPSYKINFGVNRYIGSHNNICVESYFKYYNPKTGNEVNLWSAGISLNINFSPNSK